MPIDGPMDANFPRRAMKAELLDTETELRLAYAWRDEPDEAALHRLITACMRLAISMASKFRRYGVPLHGVEMMEGRLSGSDFSLNATQSSEDEGREWTAKRWKMMAQADVVILGERHNTPAHQPYEART